MFVRGGYIVPFEGVRQNTGEAGGGVLRLLVAPDGDGMAEGSVYGDAGEGFGYRDGEFWRGRFRWNGASGGSGGGDLGVTEEGSLRWTRWERYEAVSVGLVGLVAPGSDEGIFS